MLTVRYDPDTGTVVVDNRVLGYVNDIINSHKALPTDVTVTVGSLLLVDAFRLQVSLGNIAAKDIILQFQDKSFLIESDGMTSFYDEEDPFDVAHQIASTLLQRLHQG